MKRKKSRPQKTEPRRCLLCEEIIPAADLYFFPLMAWCWQCQEAGREDDSDSISSRQETDGFT